MRELPDELLATSTVVIDERDAILEEDTHGRASGRISFTPLPPGQFERAARRTCRADRCLAPDTDHRRLAPTCAPDHRSQQDDPPARDGPVQQASNVQTLISPSDVRRKVLHPILTGFSCRFLYPSGQRCDEKFVRWDNWLCPRSPLWCVHLPASHSADGRPRRRHGSRGALAPIA